MITVSTRRYLLLLLHVPSLIHRRALLHQLLMHNLRQARSAVLTMTATNRRIALSRPRGSFPRPGIPRRRPIDILQDPAVRHSPILAISNSVCV